MKRVVVAALLSVFSGVAGAQAGGMRAMDTKDMDMRGMDKGSKNFQAMHDAVGTVKSVDAAKGTISLAHGPVGSMNWPAMTMTFKAQDKKMVEGVKPGQKIEIEFQLQGRDYVITKVK